MRFDELWTDPVSEGHELLNRWRVTEEAGAEMVAFHEASQQSDESLVLFAIGELRLKARPQPIHLELHLRSKRPATTVLLTVP